MLNKSIASKLNLKSTESDASSLLCPECGADKIAYSRLQKFDKLKMRFIATRPHRCLQCYQRFWVSEKMFANPNRIWTLAIFGVLLILLLINVVGLFTSAKQKLSVSLVVSESINDLPSQSESSPTVASSIKMPQSTAQNEAPMNRQQASNLNREFNQMRGESLTPEQRSRRLLLAKQQAEAGAQLSQARVEQLQKVLLPADDEIKSLVKIDIGYMVERWRNAWSSGDLKIYLSSYSPNFEPVGEITLEQWQATRKSRVKPERNITVKLNDFDLLMLDQLSSAVVEFNQLYQAGSYSENSRKRLSLVKQQGSWKIVSEVELP